MYFQKNNNLLFFNTNWAMHKRHKKTTFIWNVTCFYLLPEVCGSVRDACTWEYRPHLGPGSTAASPYCSQQHQILLSRCQIPQVKSFIFANTNFRNLKSEVCILQFFDQCFVTVKKLIGAVGSNMLTARYFRDPGVAAIPMGMHLVPTYIPQVAGKKQVTFEM